jgi:hypothetical protein
MRRLLLLCLAVAASACERDPMARTDDLWPGLRRAVATAVPTSAEIEAACFQATLHFKDEAEKTPGTFVDLEYADYPVRKTQCRWELGSASTAICRFEQTILPWGQSEEQRREAFARLKDRDWELHEVRMVRVQGGSASRWIAPDGCKRLPAG